MNKKRIVIAVCTVAVVGVAALLGWYFLGGSTDDGTGVYVQPVADLNMATAPAMTRFAGVVESQESKHVDPQNGKKVAKLLVEEGQDVLEGEALFRYDTDAIKLDIQQAELDLEMSDQKIASLKEEIAELSLYADKTTPEGQMNAARIQQLEVDISTEEYAQKQKKNELARLQASLKDDTAKSPITGTVRAINESAAEGGGGYDMNGNELHYITITASGDFRIKGTVSEQYIMDLYEGQPMVVHSRVNEDTWAGTISRIDTSQPEQNNNGYYYDDGNGASKYAFYVELDSTDGLMMGQHITIEPNYGGSVTMSEGLWLSAGWFNMAQDGTATVWMQSGNGRLSEQAVTLGEYSEEYDCYQVESGLTEEDFIAWPGEECVSGAKTTTTYNPEADMGGDEFYDEGFVDEGYIDEGFVDEGYVDEGFVDEGVSEDIIATDDMVDMPMPMPEVAVPVG